MRREIDLLRVEATHANLLLNALDSVLCVDGDASVRRRVLGPVAGLEYSMPSS